MSTFTPKVRLWPGQSASIDAGSWGLGVDITSYVRQPGNDGGQRITYSAGRQDEGNQIDAGSLKLTLDNRTGIWTPQNVNGTYYGLLKRNTPIQLSTDTGSDSFTRTVVSGLGTSSSGQLWTNGALWSVNGSSAKATPGADVITSASLADADAYNFDVRYTCWVDVTPTGNSMISVGAGRFLNQTNSLMFRTEFNIAGTVDLKIGRRDTASGFISTASSLAVFSFTANTKVRVRYQGDGTTLRMKAWKPANPALPDADEPSTWSVTATDATILGTKVGLYAWRVAGSTNAGSPGIWVDDFVSSAEEWTGSVVQWPTRWSMTGTNAWAPIEAAGVLRRLRQGQGELQSPLRRQLGSYSPRQFIPLEDTEGATVGASVVTGAQAATFRNVTAGSVSDLPGASTAVSFDLATSSITTRASKPPTLSQTGFAVMFLMKMASLPSATTLVATIRSTGRVNRWEIYMDAASIRLDGYESSGPGVSPLVSNTALYGTEINPLEWFAVQLETGISGGNVTYSLLSHAVGDVTYYAQSGNFVGSYFAAATEVILGGTDLDGCAFSMIWIGANTLPFVTDSFSLVSNGYAGELAADRATRVAAEAAVPLLVEAGTSEPMGAQRESTVLAALRSCELADYGILYETGSGLGFRPRVARYNAASTLTLTMASGHLSDPPEPIYDDQRLRNVWTVSRVGGSSATVVDDISVAAEGEVSDTATINVETDEVLPNHAGWRTMLGTQDDLRWPSITIDFARNAALLTYWRARRYGFRFAVATGLAQVAGAEADVIAEGYQAELWPDGWRVELNCSGASPWDVAVLDSSTTPVRADTAGSELALGVNTTAVSWSVATTAGPIWSTTTTFPFFLKCEGEIVSVTAISGGASPQTFTVIRSVNSVVKAHSAAAAVSLAYPSRVAL